MKKEQQVAILLALLFAYFLYRWSFNIYSMLSGDGFSFPSLHFVLYLIILVVGIAGLVKYYVSQFKHSQLLRLYLLYLFFSSLLGILPQVGRLMMEDKTADDLIRLMMEIAELGISFYSLKVITEQRTPQVAESQKEDGTLTRHYVPASKAQRFLNRLFDVILLILIIYSSYQWWAFVFGSYFGDWGYGMSEVLVIVIQYFMFVVYYIVAEHFFHTTFGKTITNTTVINIRGGYPSITSTLSRSFCRLIPFDSFSFLFKKQGGWHDQFSGTGVVKEKYVE